MTRRKLVGGSCAGGMKEDTRNDWLCSQTQHNCWHWDYSNWLCEHSHGTTCENRC